MVLQKEEHDPIKRRFREYRMMTSVSVPAFDRKLSHELSNEVRDAAIREAAKRGCDAPRARDCPR